MKWTQGLPAVPGWYIHKLRHEWVWRLKQVEQGDWRLTQNPEWLYADREPLIPDNERARGWWLGPLPDIPD